MQNLFYMCVSEDLSLVANAIGVHCEGMQVFCIVVFYDFFLLEIYDKNTLVPIFMCKWRIKYYSLLFYLNRSNMIVYGICFFRKYFVTGTTASFTTFGVANIEGPHPCLTI